jgi:hypothetical protein
MFIPDPDPNFSSPDPGHKRSRIRIRIKELKYIQAKKLFSKLSEILSGMFIPDPDPGVEKHKKTLDPGSATLI